MSFVPPTPPSLPALPPPSSSLIQSVTRTTAVSKYNCIIYLISTIENVSEPNELIYKIGYAWKCLCVSMDCGNLGRLLLCIKSMNNSNWINISLINSFPPSTPLPPPPPSIAALDRNFPFSQSHNECFLLIRDGFNKPYAKDRERESENASKLVELRLFCV